MEPPPGEDVNPKIQVFLDLMNPQKLNQAFESQIPSSSHFFSCDRAHHNVQDEKDCMNGEDKGSKQVGALFEMEVERALPKGEPRLAGHARDNISVQSREGNSQVSSNLELESGNIQSSHELDVALSNLL
jgi:hypothetical protein